MFTLGIWPPIGYRGHWKGEGISRVVKYAIGGFAAAAEADLAVHLYVTEASAPEVEDDLQEILAAHPEFPFKVIAIPYSRLTWALIRANKAIEKKQSAAGRTANARVPLMKEVWMRLANKMPRIPVVYTWRRDLGKVLGLAATLSGRRDVTRYANNLPKNAVDVWWAPLAGADGVGVLNAPVVAHFFDFVLLEYPSGWAPLDGGLLSLYKNFQKNFSQASQVIVTSKHAMNDQLLPHFGVAKERVHVIPNPYPSYYRTILSSVAEGAEWPVVRAQAHGIIQSYIQQCLKDGSWKQKDAYTLNYLLPYYASIDWAQTRFLFAPTQDRPYKNLSRLIDLIEDLVRREGMHDLKLVLTQALDMNSQHKLSRMVYERDLTRHVISLPRLPDDVHAACFAAAQMTVHPSYFEGGIGTATFIEGLYLGCPALIADGPHTREAAEMFGDEFRDFMFLADRPDQLKAMVLDTLQNRAAHAEKQGRIHAKIQLSAEQVSKRYLEVFRKAVIDPIH